MGCERSHDRKILPSAWLIEQPRWVKLRAAASNDGDNGSVLEFMTEL